MGDNAEEYDQTTGEEPELDAEEAERRITEFVTSAGPRPRTPSRVLSSSL